MKNLNNKLNTVHFLFFVLMYITNLFSAEKVYHQCVDNLRSTFSKKMLEKHKLSVIGTGGSMCDGVSILSMAFETDRNLQLEINGVRKLYIEMVEEFLKEINSHEDLKIHLKKYPFDINNVYLSVAFYDSQCHYPDFPYVAYVSNCDDVIVYHFYDNKNDRFDRDKNIREKYSEALRIVQSESGMNILIPSNDVR